MVSISWPEPGWVPVEPECGSPARLGRIDLECQAPPGHAHSHVAEVDGEPYFWGLDR